MGTEETKEKAYVEISLEYLLILSLVRVAVDVRSAVCTC